MKNVKTKAKKKLTSPKPYGLGQKIYENHWLYLKLEFFGKKVIESYESYHKEASSLVRASIVQKLKSQIKKNSDISITASFSLKEPIVLQSEHLFFLDTFIMDMKRLLLHNLLLVDRAVRKSIKEDMGMSLESEINHICKTNSSNPPSKFSISLEKQVPEFTLFIQENEKKIRSSNSRRTKIQHSRFPYGFDILDCKATFGEDDNFNEDSKHFSEITYKIDNKTIEEFINAELQFAHEFRVQSVRATDSVLQNQ